MRLKAYTFGENVIDRDGVVRFKEWWAFKTADDGGQEEWDLALTCILTEEHSSSVVH